MMIAQKGLWALAGFVLGVLASWGLGLAFLSLLDTDSGSLAIPFALMAGGGIALSLSRPLRPLAFGLIVGAAAETAFFIYLFAELSRGLNGME